MERSMRFPMESMKFWTFLATLILFVSVAVMLVDISIKTAILEESNLLRRIILDEQDLMANGRGKEEAGLARTTNNGSSNGNLLDFDAAGGETRNVPPLADGKT